MDRENLNRIVRQESDEVQELLTKCYALKEKYQAQFEGVQQSETLQEDMDFAANDVELKVMELAFEEGLKELFPILEDVKFCYLKDMKNILCQFDLVMKYFTSDGVPKELIDNYEAIRGSLEFINQSLWDCKEYVSGAVENGFSKVKKGVTE